MSRIQAAITTGDGAMQAVRFARGALATERSCEELRRQRAREAVQRLHAAIELRGMWGEAALIELRTALLEMEQLAAGLYHPDPALAELLEQLDLANKRVAELTIELERFSP